MKLGRLSFCDESDVQKREVGKLVSMTKMK